MGNSLKDVFRVDVQIDVTSQFADLINVDHLQRAVESAVRVGTAIQGGVASEPTTQVSIRVTDDEEIRRINREYRGVDKPTDVLSFSFVVEPRGPAIKMPAEWPIALGEIILSWPHAERQARELGHTVATEIAWLTIHGSLQLLGYTHASDADAERMEALERQALAELGISLD